MRANAPGPRRGVAASLRLIGTAAPLGRGLIATLAACDASTFSPPAEVDTAAAADARRDASTPGRRDAAAPDARRGSGRDAARDGARDAARDAGPDAADDAAAEGETVVVTSDCDLPFEPPPLVRVRPGPEFLFDPDNLPLFDVELGEDEWALLCANARDTEALELDRDPYAAALWSTARVRVAEQTFEQVAIRLKGRSSLRGAFSTYQECLRHLGEPGEGFDRKPSYKLRFNAFVPGQLVHDTARVALAGQEGSSAYLEEVVFARLARELGLAHRRANHAILCINGRYRGVFTIEEEADDQPFLRHHFPDPGGSCYKGEGAQAAQTYASDDPASYRERYIPVAGTPDVDEDPAAFADLLDLLRWGNFTEDADFPAEAPARLDLDQWLGVTALEMVLGDWDGMYARKNNYLLYHRPDDDRFSVVRFDTDLTGRLDVEGWTPGDPPLLFCPRADRRGEQNLPNGQARLREPGETVWTTRRAVIAARLLYHFPAEYLDWADRATAAAEADLDAIYDERGDLIGPWLDPHDPWSHWPGASDEFLDDLRAEVAAARAQLDALAGLDDPVPCPATDE